MRVFSIAARMRRPDAAVEVPAEPPTPPEVQTLEAAACPARPKRAHGKKGQFRADDPATPAVNEAWEPAGVSTAEA